MIQHGPVLLEERQVASCYPESRASVCAQDKFPLHSDRCVRVFGRWHSSGALSGPSGTDKAGWSASQDSTLSEPRGAGALGHN